MIPFSNNIMIFVDGFLSDNLNLLVILIFNDLEEDIDENILDCNSLLDVIEVDDLDSELATELSKNLGYNKKYKDSIRLIDVVQNKKMDKIEKIGL